MSMPNERTCREMLIPQRMARPGPSKAIRKPSPAVFTSRPRNRANSLRTMTWRARRAGRLPKCLMLYIDPPPWGHVAEWLRNGLQNRVHQFNSGRGLHTR